MMKKILTYSLMLLVFASCSLEEEINDKFATETVYGTEAGVRGALVGAYSQMAGFSGWKFSAMLGPMMAGDLIYARTNGRFQTWNEVGARADASNDDLAGPWREAYESIEQANRIIEYAPMANMNGDRLDEYLGCAQFLRAFHHFDLYRRHGRIILNMTSAEELSDFDQPLVTDKLEILDVIIADFDAAADLLSNKSEQPEGFGRMPTKQSAHAFAGLAYMWRARESSDPNSDYQNAINAFDLVINSGEYELIDWNQLWDVTNESRVYDEVLFGYDYKNDFSLGSGGNSVGSEFGSRLIWGNDARSRGNGAFKPQRWFYRYATEGVYAGDYRGETSFDTVIPDWRGGDDKTTWPNPTPTVNGGVAQNGTPFYSGKFIDPTATRFNGGDVRTKENDIFFLRYAEVLLLKAEALNEINDGPTADAFALVNEVRARARRADGIPRTSPTDVDLFEVQAVEGGGTIKDQFQLLIFNEKAIEFGGECRRWYDLRRVKRGGITMMQYMKETWIPNYSFGTNSPTYDGAHGPMLTAIAEYNPKEEWLGISDFEIISNQNISQSDQVPGW